MAAKQTVQAARADVERRETFNKAVRVLVDNQLRAGADASRADAELARAKVNLARAQQQEQISKAALADILGIADTSVEVSAGSVLGPPFVKRSAEHLPEAMTFVDELAGRAVGRQSGGYLEPELVQSVAWCRRVRIGAKRLQDAIRQFFSGSFNEVGGP